LTITYTSKEREGGKANYEELKRLPQVKRQSMKGEK
jgi:hypothetical protein